MSKTYRKANEYRPVHSTAYLALADRAIELGIVVNLDGESRRSTRSVRRAIRREARKAVAK